MIAPRIMAATRILNSGNPALHARIRYVMIQRMLPLERTKVFLWNTLR